MKKMLILTLMTILLTSIYLPRANAAFCSLRDPTAAINSFYPSNYQYRSVVGNITQAHRLSIKQHIPFTIHRSEIGKHTLYVVLDGVTPKGFIQARSELAQWGLIEIAWALNLDLTIHDLYFQRSRHPMSTPELTERMKTLLKNKSFNELLHLLTPDGKALSAEVKAQFADADELALLTIRSALKTIMVTKISWKTDIQQLQATR